MAFKTPLALEGKVEQYMNLIIDKMRKELRVVLKDSVDDYPRKVGRPPLPLLHPLALLRVNH